MFSTCRYFYLVSDEVPLRRAIVTCLVVAAFGWFASLSAVGAETNRDAEQVGHQATNRILTPVNQILTPLGIQVDLPGMRPQAVGAFAEWVVIGHFREAKSARGAGSAGRNNSTIRQLSQ